MSERMTRINNVLRDGVHSLDDLAVILVDVNAEILESREEEVVA